MNQEEQGEQREERGPEPAHPQQVPGEGGNQPVPDANVPNVMMFLAHLMAGQREQQEAQQQHQREQQEAQQQHQTAQAGALTAALRDLARREGAPGRTNRKLPTFSAEEKEEVDDWIHAVNAEARAAGWDGNVKLDMAKAALRGAAARWRPDGDVEAEWEAWSQALAGAFRKQYTLEEWFHLVKARQQEIGESAARYALEKSKLLRFCPEPFAERKFVTYLIQGIRHRQFSPGLIQNPPQTIQEFIVTYGELEKYAAFAPPLAPHHEETIRMLTTQVEKQAAELKQLQGDKGRKRETRPTSLSPQDRETRRELPSASKCFRCAQSGHMIRNCPFPSRCGRCGSSEHEQQDCRNEKRVCFRCGSSEHFINGCPNMKRAAGPETSSPYKKDNRPGPGPASGNGKAEPKGAVRQ